MLTGGTLGTGESEAGPHNEGEKREEGSYLALLIRNITQP